MKKNYTYLTVCYGHEWKIGIKISVSKIVFQIVFGCCDPGMVNSKIFTIAFSSWCHQNLKEAEWKWCWFFFPPLDLIKMGMQVTVNTHTHTHKEKCIVFVCVSFRTDLFTLTYREDSLNSSHLPLKPLRGLKLRLQHIPHRSLLKGATLQVEPVDSSRALSHDVKVL